jgi:phosphate transport system substrate-binding protein
MSSAELNRCIKNDVRDIIEVAIGLSSLVVATKKGNPIFDVTARMFYQALAEQVPIEGEFAANPHKSWKDTAKDAPDLPIHVVLPTRRTGTRSAFDNHFLQGGCRRVKEIDAIFAAAERVPLCTTLRKDGAISEVVETATGDNFVAALAQSPPGVVAVLPREIFLRVQDKLDALPIAGVLPTKENIANFDYEIIEFLRFYFKRGHMRDSSGHGVVRGIREFMVEIVKDEAFAEAGYFEKLGVVPLTAEWRENQRKIVRRLKGFQP